MTTPKHGDNESVPDGPSYEQARDRLAEIVDRLEAGGTTLEESLVLWEEGERMVARCKDFLEKARERIEAVRGEG